MLTHCLAIHHTDLISCIGVLLQFMLPLLVQLPGTGVSLHQVCTTHRARENQWKYLQIDNHCFSKSRLALLLAIFDTATFKTLALDQEHEKPQQDYTERAPCSLKRDWYWLLLPNSQQYMQDLSSSAFPQHLQECTWLHGAAKRVPRAEL